ncbi:MAG: LysM peptidoglycan-binding domain-containing protein [Bacteroidota bacterium]
MKAFQLLSLLFALLFLQTSFANTVYLEYDPGCMDRYEYRYTNSAAGFSHIVYHIRLNDQQKVILEVGIENRVNQRARPAGVKSCRDLAMNERFVRQLNKGDIQLYFVRRNGNEYNVSPVGLASYAQISTDQVGYSSIDHVFAYNFRQAANNKNIATSSSEAKVYYNGIIAYSCPKQYQFTKIRNRAGKNYTQMLLIPEIGVVEEKTGFNETDAENNRMELVSINKIPLDRYLEGFCEGKDLNYKSQGVFYSTRGTSGRLPNNSVTDLETGNNGSSGNNGNGGNNNGSSNSTNSGTANTGNNTGGSTGTNTGSSGPVGPQGTCGIYKDLDRNLYIDWETGQPATTVCGGNTYRDGLLIANSTISTDPATNPNSPAPPTNVPPVPAPPSAPVIASNCAEVSSAGFHVVQRNETLYGISRLYGVSVSELTRMNNLTNPNRINPCTKLRVGNATPLVGDNTATPNWNNGNAVHVVSRGETIYQLARRYGYTVGRFRGINNLGPNDPIYIGQRLRTSDCNCPAPMASNSPPPSTALPVPAEYNATQGRLNTSKGNTGTAAKRKVHIVKENETVFTISKSYGITVDRLRSLNNMEANEIIYPFQRLYIN